MEERASSAGGYGGSTQDRFVSSGVLLGDVTPPDYIGRWSYPESAMMSLDANGTRAKTVKRTTSGSQSASDIDQRIFLIAVSCKSEARKLRLGLTAAHREIALPQRKYKV
jgi:hypothetical protein